MVLTDTIVFELVNQIPGVQHLRDIITLLRCLSKCHPRATEDAKGQFPHLALNFKDNGGYQLWYLLSIYTSRVIG